MTDAPTTDLDDLGPDDDDLGPEDDDLGPDEAGRAQVPTAAAVLEYLVSSLVDEPDSVQIDVQEGRRGLNLMVHVAPDDMGRVIGKRGRIANAIRTVVSAAAVRDGAEVDVDFVD